jgi:hypothetical protein
MDRQNRMQTQSSRLDLASIDVSRSFVDESALVKSAVGIGRPSA